MYAKYLIIKYDIYTTGDFWDTFGAAINKQNVPYDNHNAIAILGMM